MAARRARRRRGSPVTALVLDGIGKTTALGTLLAQCWPVVFPEAQSPERGDDTVMRRLLAEDHSRTEAAHTSDNRTAWSPPTAATSACSPDRSALARLTGE